jgi:predicted CXXCH cytochrome family protein
VICFSAKAAAAGVIATLAFGIPAGAQIPPPGHSCEACHLNHSSSNLGGSGAELSSLLAGIDRGHSVSRVERTCLACHQSASDRALLGRLLSADDALPLDGGFIGDPALSTHPLGRPVGARGRVVAASEPSASVDIWSARPGPVKWEEPIRCVSCHDPHAGWGEDTVLSGDGSVCEGCHSHSLFSDVNHVTLTCVQCHTVHGSARRSISDPLEVERVCGSCHLTPGRAAPPAGGISAAPIGHADDPGGTCADCHRVHPASAGTR